MSRLLKALQKAQKEHANIQGPSDAAKTELNLHAAGHDHAAAPAVSRSVDLQVVFLAVLIVLVGAGIYMNYNISTNLASTKNSMATILDNFRVQEETFERMHVSITQMENLNDGQKKEFLAKIDGLSSNVTSQINEIQKLSKSQYVELSRTIEVQEKSISILTAKYDQLEKSVRNYSDVNSSYTEQLNALKKKVTEINSAQPQQ